MRDNIPEEFANPVRQVKARALVANDRPVFNEFPAPESGYTFTSFCQHIEYDGVLGKWVALQYGLFAGDERVAIASVALDSQAGSLPRSFTLGTLAPSGTPLSESHRAIASCAGNVFTALNGKIYQLVGGIATQIADLTDGGAVPLVALAAVSSTVVAVAAVYSGPDVSDHCKLAVIENGVVDTWKGYLSKHTSKPNIAAVQDSDGAIYIYVDDWSGKKPVTIKRFASKIWSATREILPMDALDDESSFKVGFVTKFANGRIFLTGVLKRRYGPSYTAYMLGPEKFTFGRDLVIASQYEKPLQLFEVNGLIWAAGSDDFFLSTKTGSIFSESLSSFPLDMHSFTADYTFNQGDRLSLEIPGHYLTELLDDLVPGSRLDLQVSSNESAYYTLGKYGIDRIRRMENSEGESYSIDCTSHAMKKLMDWESDTYFDYLGQGEVHGDPGDLTKLVRFSGAKYTTASGLQLESLNDDGMLYTTPPASHGGFIRCKFTNVQAANTMFGVGLNYGEETLAEAAERLGKKIEDVAAGERGRWALFAIYNPDAVGAPTGKGKIHLVDYNTIRVGSAEYPDAVVPYRLVASAYVDRPAENGTAWLAMQYQDGYARVYYVNAEDENMGLVISSTALLAWEIHKAEHENYGRGALFLRNNTGFHMAYPVMSDSDVIPLYSTLEKFGKFGVPLEDRVDKFPASNGTVLFDSEKILYTGIAGWADDRRTQDLAWVPGKILCQAGDGETTPVGTNTDFASTRGSGTPHVHGNNYLLQVLPVAVGEIITAIRVWLKTVNYPEDDVVVTINEGTVTNSAAAVALVNNVRSTGATSGKLSSDGSWVTYIFSNPVTVSSGKQYWMMIKRGKNWNHPTSTSYFQYKKMADSTLLNAGAYVFCEEDDAAVGQSGDMAFVAYGKVEGLNKEACITVKYVDGVGLPTSDPAQTWFNGCAITITAGAGVNNCYRIVRSYRYTSGVNDLYLFFVDRNPGSAFDIGTRLRAVPALYGLKRGQSGTAAAAHGGYSMVHMPAAVFAAAPHFEYYSADEDLTLAEAAESIARKAGVIEVDLSNRHSGAVTGTSAYEYVPAQSKNALVLLKIPILDGTTNQGVFITFCDSAHSRNGVPGDAMKVSVYLAVNANQELYGWVSFTYSNFVWIEEEPPGFWLTQIHPILILPFDEAVKGDFRVSLYDGHLSAWCAGRLLGAVNLGENLRAWDKVRVAANSQMTGSVEVMIPQAGTRVDSFVMDMGKTGSQLLSTLVGEKRIYYRDDGSGRLVIYTDRETVPGIYTRAVSSSAEQTDIGLATRVLLEGGEVVETATSGNLRKYGNFFKTFNIHEINNLDDAAYFANLILEDMSLNRERVEIEGAADLSVEPTDEITVRLKGGADRQVVVDAVSHAMHVDEADAVYDMRLSGRFRPVE